MVGSYTLFLEKKQKKLEKLKAVIAFFNRFLNWPTTYNALNASASTVVSSVSALAKGHFLIDIFSARGASVAMKSVVRGLLENDDRWAECFNGMPIRKRGSSNVQVSQFW